MKIICKEDIIINIVSPFSKEGIEVGSIPGRIGLDRFRWTGEKLVDLADLTEFWVREIGPNVFELHAIKVPNSSLISMAYADRKRLYSGPSGIAVYTQEEYEAKQNEEAAEIADNRNLKSTILNIIKSGLTLNKIENYVNNTYPSLTLAERNALIILYKMVYFLLRRAI